MDERTDTDLRITLAPALLAVLAGILLLADRALEGPALTVARVVLIVVVLAVTAWCGSVLRDPDRADADDEG